MAAKSSCSAATTGYAGMWELPVLGAVTAPTAVLIRPDGYVAWVGDLTHQGLPDALTWFGPRRSAKGHSLLTRMLPQRR